MPSLAPTKDRIGRLLHARGSPLPHRYLYLIIRPPTKAREPGSAYGSFGRFHS